MEELQAALKGKPLTNSSNKFHNILLKPLFFGKIHHLHIFSATIILTFLIYFIATQSVPTFVKEILGERVDEEETVTFEAVYSGNPTPGIYLYLGQSFETKIKKILNTEGEK